MPGRNVLEASFSSPPADWKDVLGRLAEVEDVTGHENVFRISTGNGPATTMALLQTAAQHQVAVQSLAVQSTTLDDVFVHYTGRALRDSLQERRDLLCAGLTELGLPTTTPQGTYFATSDISGLGWADGNAFCRALPERAGVVAIPVQGFYDPDRPIEENPGRHLVRWAFCKRPEVLQDALTRLRAADLHG